MSRKEPPQVVNFDNLDTKRRFMQRVQTLKGLQEVSIHPRKKTRSLNANAYYWAAVVQPFTEWLRDEWGDPAITSEQAHEILKVKVLGTRDKVVENGEVIELIPTTHDMDKYDFANYIDKASAWLAEFCQIVVLSGDLFWEGTEKRAS